MWSRCASLVVLLLVACQCAAAATQPLPIIVTYELKRRHDADRAELRDPKGFWVQEIVARLEDRKSAATLGLAQPATTQVIFVVARDGTIVSTAIRETSGVPSADREALAVVDRAQPFAPMPASMSESSLTFTLPLRFR